MPRDHDSGFIDSGRVSGFQKYGKYPVPHSGSKSQLRLGLFSHRGWRYGTLATVLTPCHPPTHAQHHPPLHPPLHPPPSTLHPQTLRHASHPTHSHLQCAPPKSLQRNSKACGLCRSPPLPRPLMCQQSCCLAPAHPLNQPVLPNVHAGVRKQCKRLGKTAHLAFVKVRWRLSLEAALRCRSHD